MQYLLYCLGDWFMKLPLSPLAAFEYQLLENRFAFQEWAASQTRSSRLSAGRPERRQRLT